MDQIRITKLNEVYLQIDTEDSIKQELSDHFCFEVEGAKFSPAYKKRRWDGKIRLFNMRTNKIYVGLLDRIKEFAKENGYEVVTEFDTDPQVDYDILESIYKEIDRSKLNEEQLEFQLKNLLYCVKNERATIVSPTASGKSFILYLLCRYYMEYLQDPRILIIVPTIALVSQMATDFAEYGMDPSLIHQITGGAEKDSNLPIVVSTWQSIYKLDADYANQYNVVMGDECHLYEAKSVSTFLEKMTDCRYRFGFTGTLKESKTNEMSLNGLFGPIKQFVTTKELMDMGVLSDLRIDNLILKYTDQEKKDVSKNHKQYQEEIDWIVGHRRRLDYVAKLSGEMSSNVLVLFRLVEKHGIPLHDEIVRRYPNKKVFIVHGGVDKEDRNEIRRIAEENDDCVIVASYGTFSTGINIKNLHYVVFASPYKSKIKVMQSLGRGLRRHPSKKMLFLIDLVDDLVWNDRINHTMKHFGERMRMYNEEQLSYQIHTIDI